ncbi:hypothetical protein HanXRQr2_Chr09g0404431 [Helianthus annuus]|uniref:Uncharacterized protein n=1 Tax=Helianthus annuus TaxID=4232 RepID=A0A9K3I9Z5_HELAN|nr:hypothetical protein HanXRQr2_Chr09g0404431 [Helianthus annuus]KAJ0535932.1 hypothetical protein HanIR_Chr09g0435961 [Helianthus annuus]KAJ0894558.1 hypothetical protein HanPSC8_Chr09g0390361 [Helianthus annuus]
MIFKMTKPLDSTEGDQMSKQNVEGQALMEALNVATALKLVRIVLCFLGGNSEKFLWDLWKWSRTVQGFFHKSIKFDNFIKPIRNYQSFC